MATRPDPLDMAGRLDHLFRHIAAVQERAPHHLPSIGRVVVAIESLADDRAHTIGADQEFGLNLSAIGESEDDAVDSLVKSCQAVSQMNGAAIEPACERIQQVSAMEGVIGSAVPRRGL